MRKSKRARNLANDMARAVFCLCAALSLAHFPEAIAETVSSSPVTDASKDTPEPDDIVEVRAKRPDSDLPILDQETRVLYSGESLARLFENHPQFWVERRSASEMDTRVYIDGLGPERTYWTLDGHPMSDLSVIGWQVSDMPVGWVERIDMRLGADAYLDARTFRPSLALTSRRPTEQRQLSGEVGFGLPRDHRYRLEVQEEQVGRIDVGYRSRFGGRTLYDDRGTWYTSDDDFVMSLDSERTERVSLQHQRSIEIPGTSQRIDWNAFTLSDSRRGPASLRSGELVLDARRQGLFTGARWRLETYDLDVGINYFYARRESQREDLNGALLQDVSDSYQRLNAWSGVSHRAGNHDFEAQVLGTTAFRSQTEQRSYNELVGRGLWKYTFPNKSVVFCAFEWLQSQRPSDGWLSEPMGDCGIRRSWEDFESSWSFGYTVRRPTWVEWFGDGVDLIGNSDLEPERGAGTSAQFGWVPSKTFRVAIDGRLRFGDNWITWIPSSFSTRKAINLGEFQQALLGISTRWSPFDTFDIRGMVRAAWARERAAGQRWTELTQEAPLRLMSQVRYQPRNDVMAQLSVDWSSSRPLDRQNLVFTEARAMIHSAFLWEPQESIVISLSARNVLNRLSARAQSKGGAELEVAEMGGLGFPVSGREIMLTLRLKELEDL